MLRQTIGPDRMEIVAVDDGPPTAAAACWTGTPRGIPARCGWCTRPNSGGPAAPCNRGLDLPPAVRLLPGSDDRLGPEALERLVAAADRYGSDVVLGKGGRRQRPARLLRPCSPAATRST
ncbi:hypothetical protein [Micromonospora sp. b486]|uniref:hypothetical protein n=1 Tax=Micromonospora sp. b486 TaxID=3053986 RepID=UPI00259CD04C|nr:hypothetical protein [Micromonospora sp. b486]MDM4777865.1 hypothetical protein [Micromonospora sp. b486]